MRGPLLEQKQKAQSVGEAEQADCEKHIHVVKAKALYLLKFAGNTARHGMGKDLLYFFLYC